MIRNVREVKLIAVSDVIGSGSKDDPVRIVIEIWTPQGHRVTTIENINCEVVDDLNAI